MQAVTALKKLNVPYLVSLPLVFQTTEEWLDSELGVHPVQVALQVGPSKRWTDALHTCTDRSSTALSIALAPESTPPKAVAVSHCQGCGRALAFTCQSRCV